MSATTPEEDLERTADGDRDAFARLDARPIATMSLEAQERHERREKVHRDD